MNDIKIQCGDCLEKMQDMDSESVDLIIADPPYNLGKNYGNNIDSRQFGDYMKFTRDWTTECQRVLKQTGTIYVFMGFRFISYLYQILAQEQKMFFVNWICWHYTQGIGKTRGFSPRHDDILMFSKTPNYCFNLDDVRVPQKYYRSVNNMRGANPGDVWEFSHVHYCNENRQSHPTQKPEGLLERMVLASSNPGDFVLDPFAGSGTTLRVCQQLERRCTGIEINPDYIDMIQKRLSKSFHGFDSIDPRMERIPNDLNDMQIREEYFRNHLSWFLKNHQNREEQFWVDVEKKYTARMKKQKKSAPLLFDK